MTEIKVGSVYRHFKGNIYQIVCEAHDSEDETQSIVVYRCVNTGKTWARLKPMFLEHVERDGYSGPRFQLDKRK